MNERTTLEVIAPTVEEAIQQGLSQLGLTADQVSVEVLDSGSKGLFGLGGRQVRVLLTVGAPQESASLPDTSTRLSTSPKPATPKSAESKPKQRESKPRVEKKSVPSANQKTEVPAHDSIIDTTEIVVSKLIYHMGLKAQVSAHYDETSTEERRVIQVDVRGDDLSALIGRHAETLVAFQHVASLIVGKQTEHYVQLTVDVEGYRARREKQIRQLANRMADQVTKTGKKVTMEPMPSSERRLVHIELRGHPAVVTESTGEEPYRKVVILPKE
jgi:spoIIIJ-associated protein